MTHNAPPDDRCGEASLRERLLDILRNGMEHKKALDLVEFRHNGTSVRAFQDFMRSPDLSTETRRAWHAETLCLTFFSAALDPVNHLAKMDSICLQLIECHFPKALCADAAVNKALEIMARLPSFPLRMRPLILQRLGDKVYLIDPNAEVSWENLKVAKFLNSTTQCLALAIASTTVLHVENQEPSLGPLPSLPDTLIELMDTASLLSASARMPNEVQAWSIVQAFFWATWQRCTMLILWYILGRQFEQGFNGFQREAYSLRQFRGGQQFEDLADFPDMPQYMCKWAFRLMRSDRSALTLDFRRFFHAFSETFPNQEPRCVLNPQKGPQQCDGSAVDRCQRFKGMKIIDQSAHAPLCGLDDEMCRPLYWNEESYKSVQGARAVALEEQLPDNLLRYCQASTTTLAVSHVWSHGQGGRPETHETGLNSCLHRRYCRIARDYGCTSYWLDTPCIPHERQLREHAISQINRIFAESRITLICDRDLMSIKVTDAPLPISTSEKIISTLLVCDWNVRAWTLLESMRGRKHIYILCKNDAIVSVREVLEIVYSKGCIDIAILTLTSQHLVPWRIGDEDSGKEMDVIDIPEATAILSHRHASRPGDDIVIWSLMVSTEPFFTAKDFWEPKTGILRSGYLMSDLPRLQDVPGRSWAPSRPQLAACVWTHDPFSLELKQHPGRVYDGVGSTWGVITDSGLRTAWHAYEHTQRREASLGDDTMGALNVDRILCDIVQQYNIQERVIILAYPGPHGPIQHEDNRTIYVGHLGGPLYAVISSDDETAWKWIGLYEWPSNVEGPAFKSKLLTLI
jgi:hypothetical protein